MKVFLSIVFLIEGQWVYLEGWEPREQPSYEVCMDRAYNTAIYLGENHSDSTAAVSCIIEDN